MATRSPIECPLCREVLEQPLEDHLVAGHEKRKLARLVVAETTVTDSDVS